MKNAKFLPVFFLILLQVQLEIAAEDRTGGIANNSIMPPVCGIRMYNEHIPPNMESGRADCPSYGTCDDPSIRDNYIPDENTPIKYITLQFNSFCTDSGILPAINLSEVLAHVEDLNNCFEPWRIQFVYDWRFIYSSTYHTLYNEGEEYVSPELWAARHLFTLDGLHRLNIHYLYYWGWWDGQFTLTGGATYPWWQIPEAGSIFLTPAHHSGNQNIMCHEVGHCFGLWHTFEFDGSYWVEPCGPCYDSPGGGDDDFKGDKCSDTPPTTVNDLGCNYPIGIDQCSGEPWGITDIHNYMDYTPFSCWEHFTLQQAGRMHCWLEYANPEWISYAKVESDVNFGLAPLEVQFEGVTSLTPYGWNWDFGDGSSGNDSTPNHIYTTPGVYTPSVSLDAAEGTFNASMARDIWVHADTLKVGSIITEPGESFKIDISVHNSVPISLVEMLLFWIGPADLTLDSASTAGLRTESAPFVDWIYLDHYLKMGKLRICTVDSSLAMKPDTGAIISLWFSPDPEITCTENEIRIEPGIYKTTFTTIRGLYNPSSISGSVLIGQQPIYCGDIDASGKIDLLDVLYIINYLYKSGPVICNQNAADVNNDASVNMLDILYLIAYLYKGGPEPECP
jgi:hypothetical protein